MNIHVAPKVIEGFQDLTLLVGQKLELKSKIGGIPSPEISWFKDGQRMKQSKNISLQSEAESHSLTHENISHFEEGTYVLKAGNVGGTVEVSAKLTVLQPPIMEKELSETELIEGESVKLQAHIV